MAEIILNKLSKTFGSFKALDEISLTIADGEFVSLLGPSGCGKSTTLGALAGLDKPTSGSIIVGGIKYFDSDAGVYFPPEKRNAGLVFQSYALWPHLTVAGNLEFPLKLRRIPRGERDKRIRETLTLVEMQEYAHRYPFELSGGQQQRVALARTLVYQPTVLLLDEPLSNLDTQLRDKARDWLKEIHSRVGITTVYVTHDQGEALALSDRIVVMQRGRILQVGTPQEVYAAPSHPFVAEFIGASNFLKGVVTGVNEARMEIAIENCGVVTAGKAPDVHVGDRVKLAVRPEAMVLTDADDKSAGCEQPGLPARVLTKSFQGATFRYVLDVAGQTVRAETPVNVAEGKVRIIIPESGNVIFKEG
ncbi:ABC transporter ATP-binding protein [Ensifer sp. YR511]|uniref:ABC transporter ATP-binding protein n=1 Tax=Ensifer sp. YR511 TaxID=1855294 RepID=UPI00087E40BA|nr:ABC transporter ATP-binding protein [Ensifer sp. YR511]SDO04970.1 iron(III) transport system ATP-binding protein [Ensifer sp. YR511]